MFLGEIFARILEYLAAYLNEETLAKLSETFDLIAEFVASLLAAA